MTLRPRIYNILSECIETGADLGYKRAFKHTDSPSEDAIIENIHREILNKICDYFIFEENE